MSQNHFHIEERSIDTSGGSSSFIPDVLKFLDEGHTVTIPLRGRSMRPFLQDGRDKGLLVKPKGFKRGNAVLAKVDNSRYVLHRIVKIDGDDVTLLGDGNLTVEHCKKDDVKAFVVGFYRKGSDKLDKTNGLKWTLYSAVWMALRPVRRYLLAALRITVGL